MPDEKINPFHVQLTEAVTAYLEAQALLQQLLKQEIAELQQALTEEQLRDQNDGDLLNG